MKFVQLSNKVLQCFSTKRNINHIPNITEFLKSEQQIQNDTNTGPKFYLETYGCQMNVNDSQIVISILQNNGYNHSQSIENADFVFLNTCAIRANAENKVFQRVNELRSQNKIIGLLGCMAERLKTQLFEKGVHFVVGPDSYKSLPNLLNQYEQSHEKQSNTQLSFDETYEDIMPITPNDSKTTFVSIMRGCNNMCAFCIVPFTRGRERSRNISSIIQEIQNLEEQGIKEITLLGQNVNSYFLQDDTFESSHQNSEGFKELYKLRGGNGIRFDNLLEIIATRFPNIRIRFTSPHPKDFPDNVLQIISKYPNIAKNLHMPCQSGSDKILQKMRRNYSRDAAINLCKHARDVIQGCTLSTDIIVGFCDEDEDDFEQTLDLMKQIKFENAFMFAYSMRERTHAHRNYVDNVPENVKINRLERLINLQQQILEQEASQELGRTHLVLVEDLGKKENQLRGRSDTNKVVVFEDMKKVYQKGDFVMVRIVKSGSKTLIGEALGKSSIQEFAQLSNNQPFF